MFLVLLTAARGSFAALLVASAMLGFIPSVSAEDSKAAEKPAGQEAAKEPQKIDEFTEAQKEITGPAGNPECVWLGRRVVGLLWRDDLDTAFRHLELYDRFGCPSGQIQAAFRCLVLNGRNIDPKASDNLNGRIQACWVNPLLRVAPTTAAVPNTSRMH